MAEDHPGPSPAGLPTTPTPPPPPTTTIFITVSKGGKQLDTFHLPEAAILNDLLIACEDHLSGGGRRGEGRGEGGEEGDHPAPNNHDEYDWDKARFIAKGKMLRAAEHGDQPIAHLHGAKVTLQVPTVDAIQDMQAASEAARARDARRQAQLQSAARRRTTTTTAPRRRGDQADSQYTFLRVEPLPFLPGAERSRALLHRLRDDPGVRAAMRRHKFSVGLLTEMDPASNTQAGHEGTTRLLGLNRNRGEVIELRLRTDAYDGYRDYRTVRRTLCHELAHNVFGPHDADFWALCRRIEGEVQAGDWRSGGRAVAEGEDVYQGPDGGDEADEDVPDHGGWTGGTYVLGASGSSGAGSGAGPQAGLSRRDVIARATEERLRRKKQSEDPDERGSGSDATS